jgi:very-short-patch-repair endonuclease
MARSKLEILFGLHVASLGVPMPEREYKFHPIRKWRVDFAWPGLKLAVEIEGGIWTRGRHTRGVGVLGDMEKYNALASMGWRLLRFDGDAVMSGRAADEVAALVRDLTAQTSTN